MGNPKSTGCLSHKQGILKSMGATNELSPTSKPFGFNACQCVLMCINAHLKFALSDYLWSPKSSIIHPIMGSANNATKYQIHKIILSILSPFAPTPQSVVFHRQSTNFGGHGCPVKTALFYLRILSHIKLASRPLIVYKTIHIKKLFILLPLL